MTTILGQSNVLIHGPLRVWAERGLVRIEDSRDNSYKIISVKDCAVRVKALNDMIKNSLSTNTVFDSNAVHEIQRVIDGYVSVMQRAKEQGMPEDASARRDLVRRRPTSILMPGGTDFGL
jgi:hypothetical protein